VAAERAWCAEAEHAGLAQGPRRVVRHTAQPFALIGLPGEIPTAAHPPRHRLGALGAARPGGNTSSFSGIVGAADGPHPHTLPARPAPPQALHSAATAYADGRLRDADLSPATIAQALNVSVRTLHRAFPDGESVMGYVRRSRLQAAHRELDRPDSPYTVAEVAAR